MEMKRRFMLLAAVCMAALMFASGAAFAAVINGTNGNDALAGTNQSDRISGFGGNDAIDGGQVPKFL
jgi:H+/gluconate symporter-like permease